jgi:hypothetical protein
VRRGGEPVELGFDVGEVPGDRVEIGLTLGVHAGQATRAVPADNGTMTYCHA